MFKIDEQFDSIFTDGRGADGFSRQYAAAVHKTFLPPHSTITVLNHGPRREQFLKRSDDFRAHSVSARGQQLQDYDIAIAVNNHTGKAIAVTVDKTVAIGIGGYDPAAKRKRSLYPVLHDVGGLDAIAEGEHPQRDGRGRIEIAKAQALSAKIENFHPVACGKFTGFYPCNSLRENPRIPAAHGSIAILFEDDAAGDFHSFVLAEIMPPPKWRLVVTVAIGGKLKMCIIVQIADLKIPKA
jgi:hypothetical protein